MSLARDGGYSRIVDLLLSYGAIEINQKAKEMIIDLPSLNNTTNNTSSSLDFTSSEINIKEQESKEINDDNEFEDDEGIIYIDI